MAANKGTRALQQPAFLLGIPTDSTILQCSLTGPRLSCAWSALLARLFFQHMMQQVVQSVQIQSLVLSHLPGFLTQITYGFIVP